MTSASPGVVSKKPPVAEHFQTVMLAGSVARGQFKFERGSPTP